MGGSSNDKNNKGARSNKIRTGNNDGKENVKKKSRDNGRQEEERASDEEHFNDRASADGESLPDVMPEETTSSPSTSPSSSPSSSSMMSSSNLFTVKLELDVANVLLLALGLATRLVFLEQPRHVVFDEMHYGKFACLYLRRTFFFDANPPLGKLLMALSAFLTNPDLASANNTSLEGFGFDKIGTIYPDFVPVISLRLVPAVCGALLPLIVYNVVKELRINVGSALLAGFLVLLDTALLTQSRFMLLDSMMLLFSLLSLLTLLKHLNSKPHSLRWYTLLITSALFIGMAVSTKYLALYSLGLMFSLILRHFWTNRLPDHNLSNLGLILELLVKFGSFTVVPILVYVGVFYVHLAILIRAGNHDALMTSAFQASLEGGLSSIIRGQPIEIAHGSQVTLRPTSPVSHPCWLHSHEHVYPVKYGDNRGSSHQQQVTCYGHKDVNNWWIVKRPEKDELSVHEPLDVIRDGDVIQLVHGMSQRALNSHDVAAPMSPHCQEVSCYIDYNISMKAHNHWRVHVLNNNDNNQEDTKEGNNERIVWQSVGSKVQLEHLDTGKMLSLSGKTLPDWAFHQQEVVASDKLRREQSIFNVEEHRYTKNDDDKRTLQRELFHHELIPRAPTTLNFWEKFVELQLKMIITNQDNVQNHKYASGPLDWPWLTRGIAYYISKESNAQVYLLGNVSAWHAATMALLLSLATFLLYLLRRHRLCFDISNESFSRFKDPLEILLLGFLFHYLPFVFYERTLFLHHYLTAYIFKLMLLALAADHAMVLAREKCGSDFVIYLINVFAVLFAAKVVDTFARFCVISYGVKDLAAEEVKALMWKDSWELIVHKH